MEILTTIGIGFAATLAILFMIVIIMCIISILVDMIGKTRVGDYALITVLLIVISYALGRFIVVNIL